MYWICNLLCFIILIASLFMLVCINPVNSVLFLILVFFCISLLFVFLNADFIGILILIIYIGAIAVLFLFIVMLTNIKKIEKDTGTYLIIGIVFLLILFFQLIYISIENFLDFNNFWIISNDYFFYEFDSTDELSKKYLLYLIGIILFLNNQYLIFYSSILLLLAIVCSIYLTNFKNGFSMRRQYNEQSWRNSKIYNIILY